MECVLILSHFAVLTKTGKTGLISVCLHHSWQNLNTCSVQLLYVHLERADQVATWGSCLFSQVEMFAIDHRIPEGFGLEGTLKLS